MVEWVEIWWCNHCESQVQEHGAEAWCDCQEEL